MKHDAVIYKPSKEIGQSKKVARWELPRGG